MIITADYFPQQERLWGDKICFQIYLFLILSSDMCFLYALRTMQTETELACEVRCTDFTKQTFSIFSIWPPERNCQCFSPGDETALCPCHTPVLTLRPWQPLTRPSFTHRPGRAVSRGQCHCQALSLLCSASVLT